MCWANDALDKTKSIAEQFNEQQYNSRLAIGQSEFCILKGVCLKTKSCVNNENETQKNATCFFIFILKLNLNFCLYLRRRVLTGQIFCDK